MKLGYKTGWLLLVLTLVVTVAVVAIPVWLIQPFAPQTTRDLTISYYLRTWSPWLTILFSLAAILLAVFMWRKARRWFTKIPVLLPLPIIFFFTWFAQQNHFEWMFNPLHQAKFASVADTDFVKDDDMVLTVKIKGDAVAFPVLQMAYHHVAQDVVGGTPITATY